MAETKPRSPREGPIALYPNQRSAAPPTPDPRAEPRFADAALMLIMVPLYSGTCSRVRDTCDDDLTPDAMQAIKARIIETHRLGERVKKKVKTPDNRAAIDVTFFLPNLFTSLPLMSAPKVYSIADAIKRYVANPNETMKCSLKKETA